MSGTVPRTKITPMTLEVIRNVLSETLDELEQNLVRTSFSPVVYEIRDIAAAWLDPEGKLIAQGKTGLPVFMADLAAPVLDGLKLFEKAGFARGDVVMTNHSGTCGQHLNNVVVYSPIFTDDDVLVAFTAVRTHWTDIGGGNIGSWSADSPDIFSEGVQIRTVKIIKQGEWDEELLRILQHNTRFPAQLMGDLHAQIAACRLGERRFTELMDKHGYDTLLEAIVALWDQSERRARELIEQIPDGEYEAESCLDDDGTERGGPVAVRVRVVVKGSEMEIDYSGMADQVRGPINSGPSGGLAAARVAFKYLATPDFPADEGCFQPLKVTLPPGTFISAREPAPMGVWSTPLPTVIDTTLRALCDAMPERVSAAHMGDQCAWVFHGRGADDVPWYHVDSGPGGLGAWNGGDGASTVKGLAHGDSQTIPAELEEHLHPLRVRFHRLRVDSAGAGRWRGGLGAERSYELLDSATIRLFLDRSVCPPWGLFGGADAPPGHAEVTPAGEELRVMRKGGFGPLVPGSTLSVASAGGGGYGDPLAREPELDLHDVVEGYVSREAAEAAYGVVLSDASDGLRIDIEATTRRRSERPA